MLKQFVIVGLLIFLAACSKDTKEASPFPELRGHWVIVNYWAEWCSPCRQEIPELNHFAKAHPDVKLFAVYYEPVPIDQILALAKKMGIHYPVIVQPSRLTTDLTVLPTTIVITPEGKLLPPLLGAQNHASLDAVLNLND